MKQPDCVLDAYRVRRMAVEELTFPEWSRLPKEKETGCSLVIKGEFSRHREKPCHYKVDLSVKFAALMKDESIGHPVPVRYAVDYSGFFHWRGGLDDKNLKLAYVNGAMILYGAARDRILQLSATTFTGMVCLPSVLLAEYLFPSHPSGNGVRKSLRGAVRKPCRVKGKDEIPLS